MDSFEHHHLNDEHCFLCGALLRESNRSDEHIFPEWLQREYNLWNQRLTLLNDTTIPYRQLYIPCCATCNNEPLAQLEEDISSILTDNFQKPTAHEEHRLFQWCSKILYGLFHKQMTLVADRTTENSEPILSREFLEELATFHHFMTSIRRPFNFFNFVPYSIFAVETLTFDDPLRNFDYFDFVVISDPNRMSFPLFLAIRVQHYGIICNFQDNGFQKQYFQDYFDWLDGISLHPIQFLELACKAAYKHSLLSFSPKYHSIAERDRDSEVTVIQANSPIGEIWDEWEPMTYAHLFYTMAEHEGYLIPSPDNFYVGDNHRTYLDDGYGNPLRIVEDEDGTVRRA